MPFVWHLQVVCLDLEWQTYAHRIQILFVVSFILEGIWNPQPTLQLRTQYTCTRFDQATSRLCVCYLVLLRLPVIAVSDVVLRPERLQVRVVKALLLMLWIGKVKGRAGLSLYEKENL